MRKTSKIYAGTFAFLFAMTMAVGSAGAQGVDSVSGCGNIDPDSGTPIVGSQQCSGGSASQASQASQAAAQNPATKQYAQGTESVSTDGPQASTTPSQQPAAAPPAPAVATPSDGKDGQAVPGALEKLSVIADAIGGLLKALQ